MTKAMNMKVRTWWVSLLTGKFIGCSIYYVRTINICVINIISQNLEKIYLIYVLHIYGSLLLGENVHRIAHSLERSRVAAMMWFAWRFCIRDCFI
jgi:hypothetical protein